MSSRAATKAQARLEREAIQQAAAEREQRAKRLRALLAVFGVVAVAIVAVIAITAPSDDAKAPSTDGAVAKVAEINAMLAGIPQNGRVLGRPDAPVTLVEYADLKCPICAQVSAGVLPDIIQRYVRSGQVRLVFEPQTFVGSPPGDSERGARAALAAGDQGRLWQFAELWYANQQDEMTAYATDDFIRRIGGAVQGLDVDKMLGARNAGRVSTALSEASTAFTRNGFDGTPSFVLGKTGQAGQPLSLGSLDPQELIGPIEKLLAS